MLITRHDNTQHWIVIAEHHVHLPYIKDRIETFIYGPFDKEIDARNWHEMLTHTCDAYIIPLIRPTWNAD